MKHAPTTVLLLVLAAAAPVRADPPESCTGFITTLPAVITQSGVWCLVDSLDVASTNAYGIDVHAANVTIDCDGFAITSSNSESKQTVGIVGASTATVVRNCKFARLRTAVRLTGPGGRHVVENNAVEGTHRTGIEVTGDASVIRGNRLRWIGGNGIPYASATAIVTSGTVDVVDNLIDDVSAANSFGQAVGYGIVATDNRGGRIAGNRIFDLESFGGGKASAIRLLTSPGVIVGGNDIQVAAQGVFCTDASVVVAGNIAIKVGVLQVGCTDAGNRVVP